MGSVIGLAIVFQRVWRYLGLQRGTRDLTRRMVDALSRRDIANLLGLAPETLSRVLHAFRERHWIAVDNGCISVRSNRSLAGLLP